MPSKPQLVLNKKKENKPPNTRLQIGSHIADIFVDSRSYATVHHWIVQKLGSAEIIAWGQEKSFEDAEAAARDCLNSLTRT
jgi:hypothetical protein